MSLSKSFTLIELLVVMAIIGLMTSIVIINYSGQKQEDLEEQAVLQFVSDLRRAQNMAMAVVPCCAGEVCDEYWLKITAANKYQIICDASEIQLPVNITGSDIYFLPIDYNRSTIEVKDPTPKIFTIEATTITIEKNGQIQTSE